MPTLLQRNALSETFERRSCSSCHSSIVRHAYILGASLFSPTITAEIFAWMIRAENCNGYDHWQRFEDPEHPLMGEWVAPDPFSKFDQSIDGADLIAGC